MISTGATENSPPVKNVPKDLQTKQELNGDGQMKTMAEPKQEQMEILDNPTVEA